MRMMRTAPARFRGPGTARPGGPDRDRGERGERGDRGRSRFIKKVCRFCGDKSTVLDYKESERLKRFLTEKGKIIPSRITGNCAKHQRVLARTVKRARHAGLIAFQME